MNNQYNIKDIKKALEYMESKLQALNIQIHQDENGRLKFNAWDASKNHVLITVYKNNDENTTKMPEITKTERL